MALRTLLASKVLRISMQCVCPVIGTGVVIKTVPPVRRAVHHFTSPVHHSPPRHHHNPPVLTSCPPSTRDNSSDLTTNPGSVVIFDDAPVTTAPIAIDNLPRIGTPPPTPLLPPIVPIWHPSALPEPGTWATGIIGFGLVGAMMRRRSFRVRYS